MGMEFLLYIYPIKMTAMERFKVGIIGAGHIARKMAHTLRDMEGVEPYAVASRNQENAEGVCL